jgi:hypothetical protein
VRARAAFVGVVATSGGGKVSFFRPAWASEKEAKALRAVGKESRQEMLAEIAVAASLPSARMAALARITDQAQLARVFTQARAADEEVICVEAARKLTDPEVIDQFRRAELPPRPFPNPQILEALGDLDSARFYRVLEALATARRWASTDQWKLREEAESHAVDLLSSLENPHRVTALLSVAWRQGPGSPGRRVAVGFMEALRPQDQHVGEYLDWFMDESPDAVNLRMCCEHLPWPAHVSSQSWILGIPERPGAPYDPSRKWYTLFYVLETLYSHRPDLRDLILSLEGREIAPKKEAWAIHLQGDSYGQPAQAAWCLCITVEEEGQIVCSAAQAPEP